MDADWIVGRAFVPTVGKRYEVTFGEVTYQGQTAHVFARIRVEGPHHSKWIDLETAAPIDPALTIYVVKAFRELA